MLRPLLVALLLFASPALAQVEAEPLSVLKFAGEVRLRLIVSVGSDRKVLITQAKLLDGQDHAYELTAEPAGIEADRRGECKTGTLVQAESPQLVALRFRAPHAEPPFKLILDVQTPDPAEETGCRTLMLTVEGFEP
jgi:hypothetical protein